MTTETLKVKNGSIQLPKKLRKAWKNAKVYARVSSDTVVIKRLIEPSASFIEMMAALRKAARQTGLTRKDVIKEIEAVRKRSR